MYRDTWLEVNLDAIEENVRKIKNICGKKFIAVLKADAYGCGDIQVAKTVLKAGADMLAVSSLDEALMLRNQGCMAEILVLSMVEPEYCAIALENNVSVTVGSMNWVHRALGHELAGLKVHLAVDTAMNRIGFKEEKELLEAKELLLKAGIQLKGIFTHFCCSDSSRETTDRQYLRFAELVEKVDYAFEWIHCDNSDATIFFKDPLSNACRVGISLYGISSFSNDLRPALAMYTRIFMVKKLKANETVGYGATYTSCEGDLIATVPLGYADGFTRTNQGRKVYVDGMMAEVVGRVCMDQCMLKLPQYRSEGTIVEIFGPHIPLEKMAEELGTIPYEIMCLISGRVTRTYIRNGVLMQESNERLMKSVA